jgi:hypothetical protein
VRFAKGSTECDHSPAEAAADHRSYQAETVVSAFRYKQRRMIMQMQMTESVRRNAENAVVAKCREDAGIDNPAGPLFVGGDFAEADIIGDTMAITDRCGTACTASSTGAQCPACC